MKSAARSSEAPSRRAKLTPYREFLRVARCRRARALSKRARAAVAGSPACSTGNWADLEDDTAWLIAERLLAYDVAEYLRFRAVCRSWRRCSVDPRGHGCLDRRFHPHRWRILQEKRPTPGRLRFLNFWTGKCIRVDLPELRDHELLGHSCDGFLVLLHDRDRVRLLNPLTRELTQLPPLTTLLPSQWHSRLSGSRLDSALNAWGSGNASDDSAFVLCLNSLRIVGVAKRDDVLWTRLEFNSDSPWGQKVCSMFARPF